MKLKYLQVMLIVLLVCGCSDSDESDASQTIEDTISVSVKDLSGPVITIEKETFELTVGDDFVLDDYIEVIDNVDGKLQYERKGSYDTKTVGTYEITIHAKDKSGNASNKKVTINVKEEEKEKPVESDTTTEQSNGSNNSSNQGSSGNATQNQSGAKPSGKSFLLADGYTMSGGSNAADDACLNYIQQNVSPGWKGVCRTLTDANGVPTGSEAVWEPY